MEKTQQRIATEILVGDTEQVVWCWNRDAENDCCENAKIIWIESFWRKRQRLSHQNIQQKAFFVRRKSKTIRN